MNKKKWFGAIGAGLLIPALVLTGCSSKKNNSSSNTSTQPTQASGSAQPTTKPAATTASGGGGSNVSGSELVDIVSNFVKAKSFRMTLEDGQGTQQGTLEYVAPDKYHIATAGIEAITIGKDQYYKQGSTWIKLPSSTSGPTSLFNTDQLKTELDTLSKSQIVKGSTDTVNGTKCQIYTVTETDGTKTEICVAGGLPLRIKTSDSIILIADYDKVSDIKAPI